MTGVLGLVIDFMVEKSLLMHTHPLCHVEAVGTDVTVWWVVCQSHTLSLVVQGTCFGARLGHDRLGFCVLGSRLTVSRQGLGMGLLH